MLDIVQSSECGFDLNHLCSGSVHGASRPRVSAREQHSRHPAGDDHLWQRCDAGGDREPWRDVLPEGKCPDGEEGTRL